MWYGIVGRWARRRVGGWQYVPVAVPGLIARGARCVWGGNVGGRVRLCRWLYFGLGRSLGRYLKPDGGRNGRYGLGG